MRRRVLLPLLIFGLIAVVAVLVPVAQSISDSRTQQLVLQRTAAIDQIVQRARTALTQGDDDALQRYVERFHETYGESVIVVDDERDVVAAAGDLPAGEEVEDLATAAVRSIPQWSLPSVTPWGPATHLVAVPVIAAGDLQAGAVVLAVDLRAAQADVARGWLAVGLIGVILLTALMAASLAWTRWVLRPVRALDAAVAAVAAHREPAPVAESGPPEFRRLTRSFGAMAREVEASLEQQRGFVADASHQLRTPLAGIRLRIDGLARDGSDAADLDAVDADLDRLEHTVERMLTLAQAEHQASVRSAGGEAGTPATARSCTVTVRELVDRHRPLLTAAGVTVVAEDDAPVTVPSGRTDLEEMLDVLLDNAAKYAGAGATVRVTAACASARTVVSVEDSGTRLRDDDLARMGTRFWRAAGSRPGTGLGLAIVGNLMAANGGRLELSRSDLGGLAARLVWGADS